MSTGGHVVVLRANGRQVVVGPFRHPGAERKLAELRRAAAAEGLVLEDAYVQEIGRGSQPARDIIDVLVPGGLAVGASA